MQRIMGKQYVEYSQQIILLLLATALIFSMPSVYADEDDLSLQQSCNNGIVTVSVIDYYSEKPKIRHTVYVYSDMGGLDQVNRILTDQNGEITFQYSEDTQMVRPGTDRFHDMVILPCYGHVEDKVQSIIVFSFSYFDDTGLYQENGKTIMDLGTRFGIAGNGQVPDSIILSKGYIKHVILGADIISPSSKYGDWQQFRQMYFSLLSDQGIWNVDLISNGTSTFTDSFEVRQIVNTQVEVLSPLEIENAELREEIDTMKQEIKSLNSVIMEQVKVMLQILAEFKNE